jgi:CheY-like chemotaxis protein
LILLDLLLPKVSGPEVLRTLRTMSKGAKIPIIVLSSLPRSNESQLKKDGATAYYDKASLDLEHDSSSLLRIVKQILAEQESFSADHMDA